MLYRCCGNNVRSGIYCRYESCGGKTLMNKKTLQNVVLIDIMNYGNAIVDSALFQMKNADFNEHTFRNWIMDIEHQLDLLHEEEEESND